jgi:hypothetical protein
MNDTRCAADDCREPGTLRSSTNGNGRWLCYRHFTQFAKVALGVPTAPIIGPTHISDYLPKDKD